MVKHSVIISHSRSEEEIIWFFINARFCELWLLASLKVGQLDTPLISHEKRFSRTRSFVT